MKRQKLQSLLLWQITLSSMASLCFSFSACVLNGPETQKLIQLVCLTSCLISDHPYTCKVWITSAIIIHNYTIHASKYEGYLAITFNTGHTHIEFKINIWINKGRRKLISCANFKAGSSRLRQSWYIKKFCVKTLNPRVAFNIMLSYFNHLNHYMVVDSAFVYILHPFETTLTMSETLSLVILTAASRSKPKVEGSSSSGARVEAV